MQKKFFFFLLALILIFLPSTVRAECPDGLIPINISGQLLCLTDNTTAEDLPEYCANQSNLDDYLCYPFLHGSYQLPGQTVTGDCETYTPGTRDSGGNLYPNCGWVLDSCISGYKKELDPVTGLYKLILDPITKEPIPEYFAGCETGWKWNGPGDTPSTPEPSLTADYGCEALESVAAGDPITVFTRDSSGQLVSQETDLSYYQGALACNLQDKADTCGVDVTVPGCTDEVRSDLDRTGGGGTGDTGGGGTGTGTGTWGGILGTTLDIINSTLNRLTSYNNTTVVDPITRDRVGSTGVVNVERLNVRTEPKLSAPVVRQLSRDTSFTLSCYVLGDTVEGSNKWWRTIDNYYAWGGGIIESNPNIPPCADLIIDGQVPSLMYLKVVADTLNVRTAPVTAATVVRQMSAGAEFIATGFVIGEKVEGIDKWWRTIEGYYVWSGGAVVK